MLREDGVHPAVVRSARDPIDESACEGQAEEDWRERSRRESPVIVSAAATEPSAPPIESDPGHEHEISGAETHARDAGRRFEHPALPAPELVPARERREV